MRRLIEDDKSLPSYSTVLRWADQNADFATDLARAREAKLRSWAEDIIDISDDDTLDPADKRIRVDTRKWVLSKELHRIYGDKLDVTSGGEALAPPSHQIDARIQSIVMQAQQRALLANDAASMEADGLDDEAKRLLG